MKKFWVLMAVFYFLVVAMIILVGCEPYAPQPDSDSSQSFSRIQGGIPIDDNIYRVMGTVVSDVDSLTRQTQAARGSASGYDGYYSGSFYGAQFGGKGFIRLRVESISPSTEVAKPGEIALLKSSDTKGSALLPGDFVVFKCRIQYEAIAPVRESEEMEEDKHGTWELDYCRLERPVIIPQE